MLRQDVHPHLSLAAEATLAEGEASLRPSAARAVRTLGRIVLAPVALAIAAIAGALFLILLPVCGIASVAEATAKASWRLARGALRREVRADAQD